MDGVAVCLLAHDEPKEVVLKSIEAVRGSAGIVPDEIVVITNGRVASALPSIVRRIPGVRAVSIDENLGIGALRNCALDLTRAPVVFFVDAHMVIAETALAIACAELESGACVVFGSYRTRSRDGTLTHRDLLYTAFSGKRSVVDNVAISRERFLGLTGGISGVHRERLRGLRFDTEFALTSLEDIHFQLVLLHRGERIVFLPGMTADHLHPSTLNGVARKRLRDARAYALLRARGAAQQLRLPCSRYLFPKPVVPVAALLGLVTGGMLRTASLSVLLWGIGREVVRLARTGGMPRVVALAVLDRLLWQCGTLAGMSPLAPLLRPTARMLPVEATVAEIEPESGRFVVLGVLVRNDHRHDYTYLSAQDSCPLDAATTGGAPVSGRVRR